MINVTGDFVGSVAMEENAECEKERATERERDRGRERGRRERGKRAACFLHTADKSDLWTSSSDVSLITLSHRPDKPH